MGWFCSQGRDLLSTLHLLSTLLLLLTLGTASPAPACLGVDGWVGEWVDGVAVNLQVMVACLSLGFKISPSPAVLADVGCWVLCTLGVCTHRGLRALGVELVPFLLSFWRSRRQRR